MQRVLIDACGWVACMDAQLNVERDLEALFGPCQWLLLSSVHRELLRLESERSRRKPLLRALLEQKATLVEVDSSIHTDDALLEYASAHGCATLTVDTNLKRRLYEANLAVVEVRKNAHLHLVDSL
jgi:rRNA-processing protein FCF1